MQSPYYIMRAMLMDFHLSKARAKIARATMRARAILRLVEIGLLGSSKRIPFKLSNLVIDVASGSTYHWNV